MSTPISRASFLRAVAWTAAAAGTGKLIHNYMETAHHFECRMLGPSMHAGHMLRDNTLPFEVSAGDVARVAVTIVGGGVAGLSAAWWLKKQGFDDFLVLELEKHVGGNSSSGKNKYGSYPWGAHYIPLANPESAYVRMLFEELGVIEKYDAKGQPLYNELYLCHDPQERLLKDGSFQEGLVPKRGLQPADQEQIKRFFELMKTFRTAVGNDGKPAFAIPVAISSQDSDYLKLDSQSMTDWLKENNFTAKPLLWYVNYCCRDDYGATSEHVSAWAGIHYFAGRRGTAGNAEMNSVVTWPEGNGFVVDKLAAGFIDKILPGSMVAHVRAGADGKLTTTYMNVHHKRYATTVSDAVIFAAPRFLADHVIKDLPPLAGNPSGCATKRMEPELRALHKDFKNVDAPHSDGEKQQRPTYAPWLVANVTVKRVPESPGTDLAWDNVSYYSESLGYVVSQHQNITTRPQPKVLTYYYPLSSAEPKEARRQLAKATKETWSRRIVRDLEMMHPGITAEIISIDIWPWGHGMISPAVGFLWGETRKNMQCEFGNVYFAHSDMSGISNFEEAQYHGVEAAKRVLEVVRKA